MTTAAHPPAAPFIKWAGGKRQLLGELCRHVPKNYGRYFEPFVGGGALFWHLAPKRAVLADRNTRLIRTYRAIRDSVEEVIDLLSSYRHTPGRFERLRRMEIDARTDVELAAWFIYLNRTAYNGLYRVNLAGRFNAPWGDYQRPKICNAPLLRACSDRLQGVELQACGFEDAASQAGPGDLVYFDPPYWPLSKTSSFAAYTAGGFGPPEHVKLRDVARALVRRGAHVIVSNSSAEPVRELYRSDFTIVAVSATRAINSRGSGRGRVGELILVGTRAATRRKNSGR